MTMRGLMVALCLVMAAPVMADRLGQDDAGRAVLLRDDGTWRYLPYDPDRFSEVALDPASGHVYLRSADRARWSEAREICAQGGGHLATVTSAAENAFLTAHFDGSDRIWLGGTDAAQEGTWRWITGEPWGFAAWNDEEPNNSDAGEDYLEFGDDGLWNDDGAPRNDRAFFFLCELARVGQ
ncbi:C-type lectin domain-containing protein [Pseudoponticoccus marisrubri]|uniref:C-type lectin domain-containing protein n=1 Tax=Pseudoponticoccus marisrubri TaxID=1685382 RepID=A0A0W7WGP3_9RHOB|nr:C-type lectin domain-containing protein [Pseudoponticoccus marisrubri]KUF09733.1 hypothetical protein AVJ23_16400 [Pseudoponticoccus marisrubri]